MLETISKRILANIRCERKIGQQINSYLNTAIRLYIS